MATITTRSGKGSPLTWVEVDENFTNLNSAKLEASALPAALAPYETSAHAASTYLTQINADNTYRTKSSLAASSGSSLVGYLPSGTGAVATTVQTKLRSQGSVEDFGAVGDGVTDDRAAFVAMAAANGGRIYILEKEYNVNGLSLTGSSISIVGKRMPSAKSDDTKLQNGSILIGNVNVTSNEVYFENFGVDCGSARSLGVVDGFVSNSTAAQIGTKAYCHNVASLGSAENNPTHSILIQGYENNDVADCYVSLNQFGVVVKGRNGNIIGTRSKFVKTAGVYIKSDISASAGGVGDGTVSRINVIGVVNQSAPTNTECNAVYVHASTETLSNVTVDSVHSSYGNSAVRIAGGGSSALVATNCTASNITSVGSAIGVELFGFNSETQLSNIKAINPTTGKAVSTSSDSTNYIVTNIDVVISDSAITSAECASFNGSGMWDNFSVRNPYRTMTITQTMPAIVSGSIRGDVNITGEGAITLLNGATAGAHVPRLAILPQNFVVLTGWVTVTGSTTTTIGQLPFNTSDERFFVCAARTSGGTYTTVVLYVASADIISMTSLTGLTYIDLSAITFKNRH